MASLNITRSASSGGGTLVDEPLHSPVHSPKAFPPSGPQVAANNIKPQVVPPSNLSRARTLVLCFDGTGDQFDADNSNVVLFFSLLKKDDRKNQMVYYQSGIGTYTTPQVATPLSSKIAKALDAMVAWNMNSHVMSGYEFLMQNYKPGNKICLFGFSRGAYTARALAGMIHKVGLLPACNTEQIPFAYKMYTRNDEPGWKQSTAFKKAFSFDVDVEFIGVWDTVNSVGIISRHLPFTQSNTAVKTFRHAVSLDERRAKFKANLYHRSSEKDLALGTNPGEVPKSVPNTSNPNVDGRRHVDSNIKTPKGEGGSKKKCKVSGRECQRELEMKFSKSEPTILVTDVKEVWFAGCHADVGGGSVTNDTRHNLARISLRWMIRECFKTNTGIQFHAHLLRSIGIEPNHLYPNVLQRPEAISLSSISDTDRSLVLSAVDIASTNERQLDKGAAVPRPNGILGTIGLASQRAMPLSEEEEDLRDALCPIYDQLKRVRLWWLLELLPMGHHVQKDDNSWVKEWSMNLGSGRKLPKTSQSRGNKLFVHRSVKLRLDAGDIVPGGRYKSKAKLQDVTWVD